MQGQWLFSTAGWAELPPVDAAHLGRPVLVVAIIAATIIGAAVAGLLYSAVRERWLR